MENPKRYAGILLVAALSLPPLSPAQPNPSGPEAPQPSMPPPQMRVHMPPPHMPDHPGHPPFLHRLQLSEAQQDKVFMILHAAAPRLRELDRQRSRAERDLADLTLSGHYSDAKAKPLADAISRADAESVLLRARSDSEIVALLTPEQRTRLQDNKPQIPGARTESPAPRKR